MIRKASRDSKREPPPPHNKCGHTATGFFPGRYLSKKMCTQGGEGLRSGQMWEKK